MKKILYIALLAMFLVGCDEGYNNNPSDENSNQSSSNDSGNKPDDDSFISAFSVSEDKQVIFSPGNLQYNRKTKQWSFASSQYEILGTDNVSGGTVTASPLEGYCKYYGKALANKIDLFGWSTTANHFGVTSSDSDVDYSGSFVDWGTNKIGLDTPNTWRTMTDEEWCYIVYDRPNASSLNGVAQVNGVNGFVLLPDNWTCPAGVTFKSGFHSDLGIDTYGKYQTFSAEQWLILEKAGAIFLPSAGSRWSCEVYDVQTQGSYWSASEYFDEFSICLRFSSKEMIVGYLNRQGGLSVRLVKDL